METETRYTISQAAKILGVSTGTLRRWEKQGLITPERTPTRSSGQGDRRYTPAHIADLRGAK